MATAFGSSPSPAGLLGQQFLIGPSNDFYAKNPATGQYEKVYRSSGQSTGDYDNPYSYDFYFESDKPADATRVSYERPANTGGEFVTKAFLQTLAGAVSPIAGGAVSNILWADDPSIAGVATGAGIGYLGGALNVGGGVTEATGSEALGSAAQGTTSSILGGGNTQENLTAGAAAGAGSAVGGTVTSETGSPELGGAAGGATSAAIKGGDSSSVLQGALSGAAKSGSSTDGSLMQLASAGNTGETQTDVSGGMMATDDYGYSDDWMSGDQQTYDPNDPYGGSTAYPDDSVYYGGTANPDQGPGIMDYLKDIYNNKGLMQLIGKLGGTGLGVAGAKDRQSALESIAAQSAGMGAPYRAQLAGLYADPGSFLSSPEVQIPVQQGTDAAARALSVQGNPFGSPRAMQEIQNYSANQLFGRLGQEKDRLAGFGGLTAYNQAAPGQAVGAALSRGGIYDALGSGVQDVFNPQPSLADMLKQIYGQNKGGTSLA